MSNDTVLSWNAFPERITWSNQLLESVRKAKSDFDLGSPDAFAPGYSNLSAPLQVKFWAELIVAIAKFESNWKPHEIFREPPPLGVDSVGLLQLSYEDEPNYHLEKLDRATRSLEDPLVNLRCGVKILATLIAKDRVVASSVNSTHRGGARYWSVLRKGHHVDEILKLTMSAVGL